MIIQMTQTETRSTNIYFFYAISYLNQAFFIFKLRNGKKFQNRNSTAIFYYRILLKITIANNFYIRRLPYFNLILDSKTISLEKLIKLISKG